jgi:hypothetical protein
MVISTKKTGRSLKLKKTYKRKEKSGMSSTFHDDYHNLEDEALEDFDYDTDHAPLICDDNGTTINVNRQIEHMLDSITRIGGEVCKLRAEVDGLLEQNGTLTDTFRRLRDVIDEKGMLDLDDFQLACDVFDESNKNPNNQFLKKLTH